VGPTATGLDRSEHVNYGPEMRYVLATSLAVVLSISSSRLQADDDSSKPNAELSDAARAVFSPSDYDHMMEFLSQGLLDKVQPRRGHKAPSDKLETLRAVAKESMPYNDVLKWTAGTFGKHFSKRELEEIGAFFRSPTGRKYGERLPAMRKELNAMTGRTIEQRIRSALGRRGLEVVD
jgi:hypothetical protein